MSSHLHAKLVTDRYWKYWPGPILEVLTDTDTNTRYQYRPNSKAEPVRIVFISISIIISVNFSFVKSITQKKTKTRPLHYVSSHLVNEQLSYFNMIVESSQVQSCVSIIFLLIYKPRSWQLRQQDSHRTTANNITTSLCLLKHAQES